MGAGTRSQEVGTCLGRMKKEFEVLDKTRRMIYLSKERLNHLLKHPGIKDSMEYIKLTLKNPYAIRKHEVDDDARYYYGYFKDRDPIERYLLILVKYLNGEGFVITSFFTNKIVGLQ